MTNWTIENVPSGICTGCSACAAVCPVTCITMAADASGFQYPIIDEQRCTKCGLCADICPELNSVISPKKYNILPEPTVYAAWAIDEEIRRTSSSGGVFSVLAEYVLSQGGVVCGARLDDFHVVRHCLAQSNEEVVMFRGSKYVQSVLSPDIFREIKQYLDRDRLVLFSGTPCQVAGLRAFMGGEHRYLLCCDLVCHGVPSPLLFKMYLDYLEQQKKQKIVAYSFRDKRGGWKRLGVSSVYSDNSESFCGMFDDSYGLAFLKDLAFRRSCYRCRYAQKVRCGDITIADFWGVHRRYPHYDKDDKGTSLVLVNSRKGGDFLKKCEGKLFLGPANLEDALQYNPMLEHPCPMPRERTTFYSDLVRCGFRQVIVKYHLHPPSFICRTFQRASRGVRRAKVYFSGSVDR